MRGHMHDHAPADTLQPMLASTHELAWCSFPIPACQHGRLLPNLHCHNHHAPAPAPSFWTIEQTSCPAVHGRDLPMPAVSSPHVHGHCSCMSTTCCCLAPAGLALLLAASLHLGYKKPPRRPLRRLANSGGWQKEKGKVKKKRRETTAIREWKRGKERFFFGILALEEKQQG